MRVFSGLSAQIATTQLEKGLTSDAVLAKIAPSLVKLGFEVESGKSAKDKVERPVFFGENGEPELRYQIDGFHAQWKCGIEVEAGRAFMSNAVYRDLIQAALMVDLDYLCLAVPVVYKFQTGGRTGTSRDYDNARAVADAISADTLPLRTPVGASAEALVRLRSESTTGEFRAVILDKTGLGEFVKAPHR